MSHQRIPGDLMKDSAFYRHLWFQQLQEMPADGFALPAIECQSLNEAIQSKGPCEDGESERVRARGKERD